MKARNNHLSTIQIAATLKKLKRIKGNVAVNVGIVGLYTKFHYMMLVRFAEMQHPNTPYEGAGPSTFHQPRLPITGNWLL
jgi:hypothetical protein